MIKKILTIIIILSIIGGGIYYFTQKNVTKNTFDFLNETKELYQISDFASSTLEIDEAQRVVDKINKSYRSIKEGKRPYLHYIDIGMYKKLLGDYKGTEEAWRNAVSLGDSPGLAYGNLANLYFYNLRDFNKAEEYYKKAIKISPYIYNYKEGLSDLYRYNLRAKINQIEKIMTDGAKNDKTHIVLYYAYLVDFFSSEGNKDKVQEYIKKIKKIKPDWQSDIQDIDVGK